MQAVVKATTLPEFRLQVIFADGFSAVVDLKDHFRSSVWPIVQPLKKPRYFQRVRLKHGSIVWPNDYDVCSGSGAKWVMPPAPCHWQRFSAIPASSATERWP